MSKNRVFVEGFRYDTTVREIKHFFRDCGQIRGIILKKYYAFVDFESNSDAKRAVHELDQEKLLGERITVKIAKRQPFPSNTYKVRIENLSSRIDCYQLKKFMGQMGKVVRAEAHKRYYNEGSVEFIKYEDMRRALRLNGAMLKGKIIRIFEDNRRGKSVSSDDEEALKRSPGSESSRRSRSYDSAL